MSFTKSEIASDTITALAKQAYPDKPMHKAVAKFLKSDDGRDVYAQLYGDDASSFSKAEVIDKALERIAVMQSPGVSRHVAIAKFLQTDAGREMYRDLRQAQDFPSAA
jgi:hypothetical protein